MNRIGTIRLVAECVPPFGAAPLIAQEPMVFSRTNLVAWGIVPVDSKKRAPAEHATADGRRAAASTHKGPRTA
jgi:hypothetical protein